MLLSRECLATPEVTFTATAHNSGGNAARHLKMQMRFEWWHEQKSPSTPHSVDGKRGVRRCLATADVMRHCFGHSSLNQFIAFINKRTEENYETVCICCHTFMPRYVLAGWSLHGSFSTRVHHQSRRPKLAQNSTKSIVNCGWLFCVGAIDGLDLSTSGS
jgi:hypothetical protein